MNGYLRSVGFRFAGVIAGGALWLSLIVWALSAWGGPSGLPETIEVTWPFWVVAFVVTVAVFLIRRRLGPGPGWGMFLIGAAAPFVALSVNARFADGAIWFWAVLALVVLLPLPTLRRRQTAGTG